MDSIYSVPDNTETGSVQGDQVMLSLAIVPEPPLMGDLVVTILRVVVDREVIIEGPGTQIRVVLQIKKSHRHHILIFTHGMHHLLLQICEHENNLCVRLSLLSSMLTLTWFLTAHILEYTSVDSCRLSSPLVWWLTFGILCTMYFLVLEVLVFGFLVFMVLPFIMVSLALLRPVHVPIGTPMQLFYSIILLCLGRHPLQNPHYIKPEIEKLPKAIVERIPLVIYIPPPPEDDGKAQPISLPKPVHSYPPKAPASRTPRRRFAFFHRKSNKSEPGVETRDGKQSTKSEVKDPETWEDNWEQCQYPFVRLEGNRAACAICLMDFEEPKRLSSAMESSTTEKSEEQTVVSPAEDDPPRQREEEVEIPVERITEEERDGLPRLEDAGVGPQPLRLLACGHVFHVRLFTITSHYS